MQIWREPISPAKTSAYKSDAVSIETEVDVLTKMINRETVTAKQEFGLGGQAVQTAPQQKTQKD